MKKLLIVCLGLLIAASMYIYFSGAFQLQIGIKVGQKKIGLMMQGQTTEIPSAYFEKGKKL